MSAPVIYTCAPVKLNTTVMAATDFRLTAGVGISPYQHSGNMYASVLAVNGAVPMLRFKTPAKDAYSTIGLQLLALTAGEFQLAKFASYIKSASSVHSKWAWTAGCAYIDSITVSHGGIAMAEVVVVPFSADGSSHPLTRTDSVALNTLSSEPLLHTLGPISVNGTQITGWNSLSVSMGHNLDVRVSDGDLYPRNAALLSGAPSITGEHLDPATLLTTLSLIGVAASSNLIAYCKSYDATTQVVSTANSLSFTVASGRIIAGELPASQNQAAKASCTIYPLSTSSTHPIAVSAAATAPST